MSKIGEGVHNVYKERAAAGGDVLWYVTIKGQEELAPGIPLHMSLKVFMDKKELDLQEIKAKVKEFDIHRPDPSKLTFKTTIFTSERDGKEYYMLLIHGVDKAYSEFYESLKHCGTVYKKFMPHVTIDKGLYDKINEEGLKPEEVSFSTLSVEAGSGNTIHRFEKSEDLEKSVFRNLGVAAAMTGALAMASPASAPTKDPVQYSRQKMLNAIASVESSGGKNVNHAAGGGPIHGAEHAYGKYGLMPETIRETIHMNPDLSAKYGKAARLKGNDLAHFMQDNKGLEDQVATKHLGRLEHHFGQNPPALGYAWLEGIKGTYAAQKQKKDIGSHWHAKKVTEAYSKEK
jgi:hypothetical protein